MIRTAMLRSIMFYVISSSLFVYSHKEYSLFSQIFSKRVTDSIFKVMNVVEMARGTDSRTFHSVDAVIFESKKMKNPSMTPQSENLEDNVKGKKVNSLLSCSYLDENHFRWNETRL